MAKNELGVSEKSILILELQYSTQKHKSQPLDSVFAWKRLAFFRAVAPPLYRRRLQAVFVWCEKQTQPEWAAQLVEKGSKNRAFLLFNGTKNGKTEVEKMKR